MTGEKETRLGELAGLEWGELGALLVHARGVSEAWGSEVVEQVEKEVLHRIAAVRKVEKELLRQIAAVRQSQVSARAAGLSNEEGHGRVEE